MATARFIALEARVFAQLAAAGIYNRLGIGDLLVMRLARIGLAQVAHAFAARVDDHDVLVAVRFLFT